MRHRSKIWVKLAKRGQFYVDVKAVIGKKEYRKISAPQIEHVLMSEPLSVGNCNAATLQVSILMDDEDEIPEGYPVTIKARLLNLDMTQASEYMEFGTYFIDQRQWDGELLTLTGYDALLKTNQAMVSDTDSQSDWPKPMSAVVTEIAYRIGVPIDRRTTICQGTDYQVPWPEGLTMQQVLGYIGACHGGNWTITDEGCLLLVPLVSSPIDTCHILDADYEDIITARGDKLSWAITDDVRDVVTTQSGSQVPSILQRSYRITDTQHNQLVTADGIHLIWADDDSVAEAGGLIHIPAVIGSITTGKRLTVSRVTMTDLEGNTYTAGNDSGYEIRIESNPYVTQGICNALYQSAAGLVYDPYTATQACFDPATELGDQVKIGDRVCSVIYSMSYKIGAGYWCDLSAPSSREASQEYPYLTNRDKNASKEYLESGVSYNGVNVSGKGFTVTLKGSVVKADTASFLNNAGTKKSVRKFAVAGIETETLSESDVDPASTDVTPEVSDLLAEILFNGSAISMRGRSQDGMLADCIYYDRSIGAYRISTSVQIDALAQVSNLMQGLNTTQTVQQTKLGELEQDIDTLQEQVDTWKQEKDTQLGTINSLITSQALNIISLTQMVENLAAEVERLKELVPESTEPENEEGDREDGGQENQ